MINVCLGRKGHLCSQLNENTPHQSHCLLTVAFPVCCQCSTLIAEQFALSSNSINEGLSFHLEQQMILLC